MKQARFSSWVFCGLLITAMLLSGCLPLPTVTPTPVVEPTEAPTCAPAGNFYSDTESILGGQDENARAAAGAIYVESLNARAANDQARLIRERSKALQFLTYTTARWSRIVDVPLAENLKMRVTATFISPELIHAVLLNHAIYGDLRFEGNDLSQYARRVLELMDKRREYLVFLTFQASLPEQAEIQVEMPAETVQIKKSEKFKVDATYTNDAFSAPFKLKSGQGQRAGFVYFPFQVKKECKQILNASHDNFILLVIEGATINGQSLETLTFQIPFVSTLPVSSAIPTPNPNIAFPPERYSPSQAMPAIQDNVQTGTVTALTNQNLVYWLDVGRFVWANLTGDYFPTP